MIELTLPIPPSDNVYYGKPKGKRTKYLTKAGRVFKHEVAVIVNESGHRGHFGRKRIAIKVVLHLPSGGDIWNRLKALGDALEYSEVFDNDRQIDHSTIIRGHRVAGGRCNVTLWEL